MIYTLICSKVFYLYGIEASGYYDYDCDEILHGAIRFFLGVQNSHGEMGWVSFSAHINVYMASTSYWISGYEDIFFQD